MALVTGASSGIGAAAALALAAAGARVALAARRACWARSARTASAPTCVEPGAVRTEFVTHVRPDVRAAVEQRLGAVEQLESEDVAAAVPYAVTRPRRVNVNILTLYPTQQA